MQSSDSQPDQPVALESFARVASYPVVSSVFQYATFFYSNVKKSESPLVQRALSTAERVVAPLARLPEIYPSTVKQVDTIALRQLDTVESFVTHGTQYVSSSKYYATGLVQLGVDYRQRFGERMNQVVEPISTASKQTLSAVRNISPFTSEQVFFYGKKSEEKKNDEVVSESRRSSIFTPVIGLVSPLLDSLSEKKTFVVRRVNDSVQERRKFASEMFRHVGSVYQSTLVSAENVYLSTVQSASEKLARTKKISSSITQQPFEYYRNVKQSSGHLLTSSIALGISVPRFCLQKVRSAVVVLEKHRSSDSEKSTHRLSLLLPAPVFHYVNASIDFSDSVLFQLASYFDVKETNQTHVDDTQLNTDAEKEDNVVDNNDIDE